MIIKFHGVRGGYPTNEQMFSISVHNAQYSLLIDVGSTLVFRDLNFLQALSDVLITHCHHDHVAMLPHLILAKLHHARKLHYPYVPLRIYSPEPLQALLENMDLHDKTDYTAFGKVPESIGPFYIQQIEAKHPVLAYSYKITSSYKTIVITGDTTLNSELIRFCQGADLVIAEASYSNENKSAALKWGHMIPFDIANLIEQSQISRVVLTHFIQMSGPEFASEVIGHLNVSGLECQLIVSTDGMEIQV